MPICVSGTPCLIHLERISRFDPLYVLHDDICIPPAVPDRLPFYLLRRNVDAGEAELSVLGAWPQPFPSTRVCSLRASTELQNSSARINMAEGVKEARTIVQDDKICGGDPILEGTRIRVSDVVTQVEYRKKTPEEVVSSFPALSVADVYAALTYYHERPSQIRKEIRGREAFLSEKAEEQ